MLLNNDTTSTASLFGAVGPAKNAAVVSGSTNGAPEPAAGPITRPTTRLTAGLTVGPTVGPTARLTAGITARILLSPPMTEPSVVAGINRSEVLRLEHPVTTGLLTPENLERGSGLHVPVG